jgi:hypothetical protein
MPAMAMAVLAELAKVSWLWASGPLVSRCGSFDPVKKVLPLCFFIPGNFRKVANLVKCITNYLLIRKRCIIYQNVQKNESYLLMLSSCIVKQV